MKLEFYAPESEAPYQIAAGELFRASLGEIYVPEIWKRVDGTYTAEIYTGNLDDINADYIRLGVFPTLDEAIETLRTWHEEQSA